MTHYIKNDDSLENLMAGTSYLIWFLSGIMIYVLERKSRFARFHALQSIGTFFILFTLLGIVKLFFGFASWPFALVVIFIVCLQLFLMVKSMQGEYLRLPYVGKLAEKYLPQ